MINTRDTFMRKVTTLPSGCWEWTGTRNREGYGIFDMKAVMKSRLAHRISYALFIALPSTELKVCHRCDNPPCVNPTHLFLGTDADNNKDKVRKGRLVTPFKVSPMCKRGHLFTEASTYVKPDGKRICRICDKNRRLKRKQLAGRI